VTHGSCGTRLTKSPSRQLHPVDRQCVSGLPTFQLVTKGDIRRLISRAPCKHYDLDPAPTWLVKRVIDVLAPVTAAVCLASLQSGFFSQSQKLARVTAHLKKPSMDPDYFNSFRPISNLTVHYYPRSWNMWLPNN